MCARGTGPRGGLRCKQVRPHQNSAAGFDVPALAVGGLVGRLSKRPRAPLDLVLAATLSHAVPATNALKLGPLLAPVQAAPKPHRHVEDVDPALLSAGNLRHGAGR